MKRLFQLSLVILLGCMPLVHAEEEQIDQSLSQDFNDDWSFYLGENVEEASWQSISIPHDWSIYEPFTSEGEAESGYKLGGVGWYKKVFTLPNENEDKIIQLRFGGIYMNATIFINGKEIAYHPYGYTPFYVELSDDVLFDQENELLIRVDNTLPSSRWYSGYGIYRNVELLVKEKTYIENDGIVITSPKLESQQNGDVETIVRTTLTNRNADVQTLELRQTIFNEDTPVTSASTLQIELDGNETASFEQSFRVARPSLWSPTSPTQYQLKTQLFANGEIIEESIDTFGYRYTNFDANTGFYLNGQPLKLKGVCMHHDQGALGAIENETALRRQLTLMKEMGANAIRLTHNPGSDTVLKLCEEMGFLVVEEFIDTWTKPKNFNFGDYSQIYYSTISDDNHLLYSEAGMTFAEYDMKSMVRRGINNPAIFAWSIGNEILGNIGGDVSDYPQCARDLTYWIQSVDSSRWVTIGNITREDPIQDEMDAAIVGAGGVIGYNYARGDFYDQVHQRHPDWLLYGAEVASTYGSRGYYESLTVNQENHQITAYDVESVDWGSTAQDAWLDTISRDFIAGEFIWIGFDYLGEPEPWNGYQIGSATGGEPSPRSSYFGVVDTSGFPKDVYYFYQSQWRDDVTTLHILPAWNEEVVRKDENGNVLVVVYSDAPSVELFLNDTSLGIQSFEQHQTEMGYQYQTLNGQMSLSWQVPFEEGVLKAVAYDADMNEIKDTVGRNIVTTAKAPQSIQLRTKEKQILADGKSLSYVEVSIVDENGNLVPNANHLLNARIDGPGKVIASDNGDPTDLRSFQSLERNAFYGKALYIIESTTEEGTINLTVSNEELGEASISVVTYIPKPEEIEPPVIEEKTALEQFLEFVKENPFIIGLWVLFILLLVLFIRRFIHVNSRR